MPRESPWEIVLTDAERIELETRARKYTSSYIDVVRAKIVLYAADRMSNVEISQRLDVPRQIVSKWRKRFFEQGLHGLEDESRNGRPRVFSPSGSHGGKGAGV